MKTQRYVPTLPGTGDSGYHTPAELTRNVALAKTELRKTIQSRREAKGLGSVGLNADEEKRPIELSAEEKEKINTRRERNRLSAQKCRKRRREQVVYLSQEARAIQEANSRLEREIHFLQLEKEQLSGMLREHCCNMTRGNSLDVPCNAGRNYCNE